VVHQVAAESVTAASQAAWPDVRGGIHQDPGGVEGGSIQENNLCLVFVSLVGFSVEDLHTCGLFRVLIIKDFGDNGEGTKGQVACFGCRRQGG
jgi:hypothetical protein